MASPCNPGANGQSVLTNQEARLAKPMFFVNCRQINDARLEQPEIQEKR